MRNQWHHKGLAEYMTKQRFSDLGLTSAAIGVRDRTFGTQLMIEESDASKNKKKSEKNEVISVCFLTPDCPGLVSRDAVASEERMRTGQKEHGARRGPRDLRDTVGLK